MRLLSNCLAACAVCLSFALPASARDFAGLGRLLTNDLFATVSDDRWRTGSGVLSMVWAQDVNALGGPARMGDVLEFRFRGEVISPANLVTPRADDRPYAAALSFGLHTHFSVQDYAVSLGADLVVTGPQTGLPDLQSAIHDVLGVPKPSAATLGGQIANGVYGSATAEVSRRFDLSPRLTFRPFVEVQGGVETLARIGGDIHFGALARDEFMLRDVTTGQRYRVRRGQQIGWAFTLGADLAYVADSLYLPASSGVTLTEMRGRARAGVHWQGRSISTFYGLTWLSKEFDAQPQGQAVGSVHIDIAF